MLDHFEGRGDLHIGQSAARLGCFPQGRSINSVPLQAAPPVPDTALGQENVDGVAQEYGREESGDASDGQGSEVLGEAPGGSLKSTEELPAVPDTTGLTVPGDVAEASVNSVPATNPEVDDLTMNGGEGGGTIVAPNTAQANHHNSLLGSSLNTPNVQESESPSLGNQVPAVLDDPRADAAIASSASLPDGPGENPASDSETSAIPDTAQANQISQLGESRDTPNVQESESPVLENQIPVSGPTQANHQNLEVGESLDTPNVQESEAPSLENQVPAADASIASTPGLPDGINPASNSETAAIPDTAQLVFLLMPSSMQTNKC
ncbi:uncharacterized protein LOC122251397 [Penaeus japonicus]|uniref:uncharacterized protein LOC122251397 n=1 Tax=Penaeus japonicus TaxID=27405 RepID=UPI001C717A2E|nr:uncharacterized protein LOC122251397 [Penaeus japonicus]